MKHPLPPAGPISGFENYSESQQVLFSQWKQTCWSSFAQHGFAPFHARPVEKWAHLHTEGEIEKQIYTLTKPQENAQDNDLQTRLGLPYDRTIPLAIYVAQHYNTLIFPYKRADIAFSFRGERPQAGRFRGFIQADIDIIDHHIDHIADTQCILALLKTLEQLKVGPTKLFFNHITIAKTLLQTFYTTPISPSLFSTLFRILDKQDKINLPTLEKELSPYLPDPSAIQKLFSIFLFKGSLPDFIHTAQHNQWLYPNDFMTLEPLFKTLEATIQCLTLEHPCRIFFNPGLVRGLQYYTGIVFETFLDHHPFTGSIASGGRYQSLVDTYTQKKCHLMGTGGSIGLTRLFDVLWKELPSSRKTLTDVLIGVRDLAFFPQAFALAQALRTHTPFRIDILSGSQRKIKHILEITHKKKIPFCILIMEPEAFVLKNMEAHTQQEMQSFEQIITALCAQTLPSTLS